MSNEAYIFYAILLGYIATYGCRLAPLFLFRSNKVSENLAYIRQNMPLIIMVVLVFYCLFAFDFSVFPYGLDALFCCLFTLVLYIFSKSPLLAIFLGTLSYMLLSRLF